MSHAAGFQLYKIVGQLLSKKKKKIGSYAKGKKVTYPIIFPY